MDKEYAYNESSTLMKNLLDEKNAQIDELKLQLSGKTFSCHLCEQAGKKIETLQAENQRFNNQVSALTSIYQKKKAELEAENLRLREALDKVEASLQNKQMIWNMPNEKPAYLAFNEEFNLIEAALLTNEPSITHEEQVQNAKNAQVCPKCHAHYLDLPKHLRERHGK